MGTPTNTGTCRSCRKPVIWTLTEKGKRMPIDADPEEIRRPLTVADGNLIICRQGTDGEADTVRYVPAGKGRYRSHFASCSSPAKHRKPR